jgi:hypothetical protein
VLVADPAHLATIPAAAKAFLAATARGFAFAAEQPDAAAALFVALAAAENPDLPTPLDGDMCAQSTRYLADEGAFLDAASGAWGRMDASRWAAFVDWLHTSGLLTSAMQSRSPDGVNTVSLDDLRAGKAGEARAKPRVAVVHTRFLHTRCVHTRECAREADCMRVPPARRAAAGAAGG